MTTKITSDKDWVNLLKFAEAGDNVAQYEVASSYDYGRIANDVTIVKENKLSAFEWYYKAYKNGNNDAIVRTADFLSEGIYCELNKELAIELYKKGIANGSSISASNLAIIFRDKQDYKKAFELYNVAQDIDKPNSLRLAFCFYYGIGTEKDIKKAYELLLEISQDISAFSNSRYEIDEANYLLGKMHLDSEVVEKSIQKACYFLELANSDHNHRSAQQLLTVVGRNI